MSARATFDRLVQLAVKVANPKLVKIAEYDVAGPIRDGIQPIVESLPVMELEF